MTTTIGAPVVTRDPRFSAGRKLVERGLADEAIAVYATLLEETTQQYGGDSIEAAPAYYEYGNSLLRARAKREAAAAAAAAEEEQQQDAAAETETAREEQRASAAAAAERRQQAARGNDETTADQKPAADPQSANTNENENENDDGGTSGDPENDPPSDPANQRSNDDDNNKNNNNNDGDNDDNDDDDDDDRELALEMMENSFSILEEYNDRDREQGEDPTPGEDRPYAQWVREQLPRVLLGLGDTLSTLDRHADAADAYSRALEWRRAHLQSWRTGLLIAEALLACPPGADVVATETGSLIVTASERVSYARGYYDQARDALQEAVVAMGALPRTVDLGREKEDVCFLATLVMGVGETLAAIDEQGQDQDQQQAAEGAAGSTEPATKKAKRG
eukprot:jgi/Psemu1/297217/fgenesh1_pm.258_\